MYFSQIILTNILLCGYATICYFIHFLAEMLFLVTTNKAAVTTHIISYIGRHFYLSQVSIQEWITVLFNRVCKLFCKNAKLTSLFHIPTKTV